MTDTAPAASTRWRPGPALLVRGSLLSFLIGALIGFLLATGAGEKGRFDLGELLWSGLVGALIFLVSVGLMAATQGYQQSCGPGHRALVRSAIFFAAGVVAWTVVHLLIYLVDGPEAAGDWTLAASAFPLALTGVLALLFGSGFYAYERLRGELSASVSRLKEAEFAERELEIARSIQRRLLPPAELSGEGYRVAARNLAARWVAGDFYDVFALPDGGLGVAVADVSGKGIGTGLIMASVKAVLPLLAAGDGVEATLARLNRRLVAELEPRQFVALCLARLDPLRGELTLANAGLPDPYLLRPGAAPEPLAVPGPRLPLGLRADQEYGALRLELAPGDRLLLFTDGLAEARTPAGEPLGYEALPGLFPNTAAADSPAGSPAGWLDALLAAVRAATGDELDDDWTALVLERRAPAARS